MEKNQYQVVETQIKNEEGSMQRAWNVVDTEIEFTCELFTNKANADFFASMWSKQNA
jgi:hypothetical protein